MKKSSISLPQRLGSRFAHEARFFRDSALACMRGRGVRAYWYDAVVNFGDAITPMLLRHYGYSPIYCRPGRARLASTGSILEHLPPDYSGVILGSGFIDAHSPAAFPLANVLGVRGKLTRARLGAGRECVALGDPGLLASRVMRTRERKVTPLGIVPHYTEKDAPHIRRILTRMGSAATLVDVQDTPEAVFAAIDRCERIISSSLHGLIIADSLGIPSAWLAPAGGLLGGRYKFDDYYSAFGFETNPHVLTGDESAQAILAIPGLKPEERIEELKVRLESLWRGLGDRIA